MEPVTATLLSIAGLALLVTKLVDGVRNAVDEDDNPRFKVVWNLCAFGFGIAVAYIFVGAGFEIAGAGPSTIGTGLLIGAAASGWHEVLSAVSAKSN